MNAFRANLITEIFKIHTTIIYGALWMVTSVSEEHTACILRVSFILNLEAPTSSETSVTIHNNTFFDNP
jgi:hypothetical protein